MVWTCPQDGARLGRGAWDWMGWDFETGAAWYMWAACPTGGHPVTVTESRLGAAGAVARSYLPPADLAPAQDAPAVPVSGLVIRTRRSRR